MNEITESSTVSPLTNEAGYDPIEERLRANVRATIEAVFEEELAEFLGRVRYGRGDRRAKGYRHGHGDRNCSGGGQKAVAWRRGDVGQVMDDPPKPILPE